jgi:hypothetical protein
MLWSAVCRDENRVFTDGTSLAGLDRTIGCLSRELTCLIDLGVLTSDEEAAFSEVLEDLRMLAARAGSTDGLGDDDPTPARGCRHELSRMIRLLAADLDLAYQRLGFAA